MSPAPGQHGFWFQSVPYLRWRLVIWLLPVLGLLWTVSRAPDWLEPRRLTVEAQPGQSLTLGREALWAPRADEEHILLRREGNREWRLANISASKQVLWWPASGGGEQQIRKWPLTPGAAFAVGNHHLTVLVSQQKQLSLQAGDQRWEYDGIRLYRAGQPLPECRRDWRGQMREGLGALGLSLFLRQRPLRLGGGVYCADRLGLAGVPLDTVAIEPAARGFVLASGSAGEADGVPVTVAVGTPDAESLWRRSIVLAKGDVLLVGHTQYRVVEVTSTLGLAVETRARRVLENPSPPAAAGGVAVQWVRPAWLWPPKQQSLDWRFGLILLPLALSLVWRRLRPSDPVAGIRWRIVLALTLGVACLILHLQVVSVPMLWPYLAAWPVLLVWLFSVSARWSIGLLAILGLLLGGGLVALLQLGVGAGEDGWQRYGGSTVALAGAFGWLVWAGWRMLGPIGWLNERRINWLLHLLCVASLALLGMQVAVGDEGGWMGLQPFELTQLALVAAAARALTLRGRSPLHGWSRAHSAPWLRYLAPLALFTVVCGFALVFLRDFSPLVLLGFWGLAMLWAYLRAHPLPLWRWTGQAVVVALLVLIGSGLTWVRDRPETFALPFQADRIAAWAAPEQYPHAGYQPRRALEAIRAGGWSGKVWSEAVNGRVMTVPVVESDFAPTFF